MNFGLCKIALALSSPLIYNINMSNNALSTEGKLKNSPFYEPFPWPPAVEKTIPANPLLQPPTCPKCGLVLSTLMGYVCPQPMCPTGLGGVWSSL